MKYIPLSQARVAIVDDEDHSIHSESKWCFRKDRDGNSGYAVRHVKVDGKDRLCYLHRLIMGSPEGREVIFLNHDKLDCRRENLRIVTTEEARQHHRVRRDSKSGVKGVRYNPDTDTWSAYVYRGGICHHVATHHSKEAAAAAYEAEVRRENPELHTAPNLVEKPSDPGHVLTSNPDGKSNKVLPAKTSSRGKKPSALDALASFLERRHLQRMQSYAAMQRKRLPTT